jgi:hypothetical protein
VKGGRQPAAQTLRQKRVTALLSAASPGRATARAACRGGASVRHRFLNLTQCFLDGVPPSPATNEPHQTDDPGPGRPRTIRTGPQNRTPVVSRMFTFWMSPLSGGITLVQS